MSNRTTPSKTKRGNVFKNGLRYMQAINTLVDADDPERMTRHEMRVQARTWKLKGTGKKTARRPGRLRAFGEINR